MYIYQQPEWPKFKWNSEKLLPLLSDIHQRQGHLIGRMESLGFSLQAEATLNTITLEIIKSNEIEGEMLDREQVRSSLARKMGMDIAGLIPSDRNVDGVVEMMLDATQHFDKPLTAERLFDWQASLFPSARSGMRKIVVGHWRNNTPDDPMQVVSGAMGKEKIHFEAPAGNAVPKEMTTFLKWFNTTSTIDSLLKAGVAHLWFLTVHPFDDGNGRIARAITDMQLSRADNILQRFYSMSVQIRAERKGYYEILEKTQKGRLDITNWLQWFLQCLDKALTEAERTLSTVVRKAKYWDWMTAKPLNDRQRVMLNKLLDGFEGNLTTSKWAKMTKSSQDTALRDILNLVELDILQKAKGGGRSTSYELVELI